MPILLFSDCLSIFSPHRKSCLFPGTITAARLYIQRKSSGHSSCSAAYKRRRRQKMTKTGTPRDGEQEASEQEFDMSIVINLSSSDCCVSAAVALEIGAAMSWAKLSCQLCALPFSEKTNGLFVSASSIFIIRDRVRVRVRARQHKSQSACGSVGGGGAGMPLARAFRW